MSNLLDLPPLPADGAAHEAAIRNLEATLALDAVERDLAGGHAAAARDAVRASGLLALTVPAAYGGEGAPWTQVLGIVRRLARIDGSIAHLLGFHHLQLVGVLAAGNAAQHGRWLPPVVAQRQFWGNALNPLDRGVVAQPAAGGYVLSGRKGYTSGARGADRLVASGWHEATQSLVIGVVDPRHPGVTVHGDWDAFGQRQTDSGAVSFDAVPLPAEDVLQPPGTRPTSFASLRTLFSQLVLSNLFIGLAEGALQQARDRVAQGARPWVNATGVERLVDDPYQQHRAAELLLAIRSAARAADEAGAAFQQAWSQGPALEPAQRGQAALVVAEAKVLSHRAALSTGEQIFDLLGARAVGRREAFDRFWRNARVHTLHDPVDYKLRDLGRWALDGVLPSPSLYA